MIEINFSVRESLNPFGSPRPKSKRTKSKEYLEWHVRTYPLCLVPGCCQPAQRHHVVGGRSRNSGASDFKIVPLCAKHHAEIGSNDLFQKRHGVDFAVHIECSLIAYGGDIGVTGTFDDLHSLEIALIEGGKKWRRAA